MSPSHHPTAAVPRPRVEAFYRACARRDLDPLLDFFDPAVEWRYSGPPAVLPYCGVWHGRAEVRQAYSRLFDFLDAISFTLLFLVVENDRSAALIDFHGRDPRSGRVVTSRVTHFARWYDGRIVEFRGMLDSLDTVEQVLGQELVPSLALA